MDAKALEQHIVICSCVTKTPEVKYHQPWCSYRQVAALKERIEALVAAAKIAVHEHREGTYESESAAIEALAALLPGGDELWTLNLLS